MSLYSFFAKFILFTLVAMLLSQCAKETNSSLPPNHRPQHPYTMPALTYLALANAQSGSEAQSLRLKAAGRYIYDGQWAQGLLILTQMDDLSVSLANEKNILLAKVDLMRELPQEAIAKLAAVQAVDQLAIFYQIQYHEILAVAYQATGQIASAISERIKLTHLLSDEASKVANARALWENLTTFSVAEFEILAAENQNKPLAAGWLQLAIIAQKNQAHAQALHVATQQWQARYPDHPGNYLLPFAKDAQPLQVRSLKKMALLLPLTGPLAGPGQAIREGFLAAHAANGTGITVRDYDTNTGNVAALYNQAVAEGANYIVGPLSKVNVAVVAKMHHPVPTLLLNDLSGQVAENAYSFGLSPGDEAKQVAVKARKNNHRRALVIAPTGPWGDEVLLAFSKQWQTDGGHIADVLHYRTQEDFNKVIPYFLHINESEGRAKQLKQLLGYHLETIPARRQDFDMIFLLAYPSKARQIMPMLKYYYAGDVPVYATSHVYAGNKNARKDRDLDGIIFCDMPWVFAHEMRNKNWPELFNSYSRLYALGMDSYALATQLNQLLASPEKGLNNKSGVLYLNSNQHITRTLVWGKFKQGIAQLEAS